MYAAAGLPNIERPAHVSPETHHLVLKTMVGGENWRERKEADDALVALRYQRMAELRRRAAAGGVDGIAAALVSKMLEDLDGERLTRAMSTQGPNDVLVVHVHSPSARGSAVLDAAVATLAARHAEARRRREEGADTGAGSSRKCDVRRLPGDGALSFARLSAVDAGVTARLDVVDESALPAILVYRAGALANSRLSVALPSSRARVEVDADRREGVALSDKVDSDDDLDTLADEVEDLLDELGLFE
jgi:hypothetical protein